jgi:hypothetical protein
MTTPETPTSELDECMARCLRAETENAHLKEQNRILAEDRATQNRRERELFDRLDGLRGTMLHMAATYNELVEIARGMPNG